MTHSVGPKRGHALNPLPAASPHNRRDDSAVVTEAYNALIDFFGPDRLTQTAVRTWLPQWQHFRDLSAQDMTAVLRRFPGRGDAGSAPQRHDTWE